MKNMKTNDQAHRPARKPVTTKGKQPMKETTTATQHSGSGRFGVAPLLGHPVLLVTKTQDNDEMEISCVGANKIKINKQDLFTMIRAI